MSNLLIEPEEGYEWNDDSSYLCEQTLINATDAGNQTDDGVIDCLS